MSAESAQRWFVVGLIVLFGAVSVQYTAKVLTPRNGETTRSAIVRWREQLQGLDAGENIYARYTYPNPPVMALMLRPLADLPPLAGALTWFGIKVGLSLACFAMAFRLAEEEGVPFPPWAKALTVMLAIRPVIGDLTHGNINLLIAFLVISGLYLYRRRWDFTAGVVIALAVACKVTPALFIPYFVWKRAWVTLAGVAVGLGLFFLVLPAAALGWNENLAMLNSWFDQMVKPFLIDGFVTPEHSNQSLPGLVQRLFTHSPSFSDYDDAGKYVPLAYHNVADIGAAARWVVKGCMAVFAGLIVLLCRTPTSPRASGRLAAEYALVTVGMLLFSERTWKHHAVTLILPFAVLCYQLSVRVEHRRLLTAILVTATVLMSATSTGLLPDAWAKFAQVFGGYTAAFILIAVGLAATLRQPPTLPLASRSVRAQAA